MSEVGGPLVHAHRVDRPHLVDLINVGHRILVVDLQLDVEGIVQLLLLLERSVLETDQLDSLLIDLLNALETIDCVLIVRLKTIYR